MLGIRWLPVEMSRDFDGDGFTNILDVHYSCDSGTYHDPSRSSCVSTDAGHYFDRSE